MKTFYRLILILFICFTSAKSFSQWQQSYNGSGNGNDVTNAVAVDASDNLVVTGYSTGIGSGKDITTIKYNASGVQQWVRTYNGTGNDNDEAYAITIDGSGNIYITGYSYGNHSERDIITIMYDANGNQQWLRRLSSADNYDDEAYAITIDGSGNIYIAGYMYGDNKGNEMTLVKYNSSGTQQWITQYNGETGDLNDEAYAITIDGSGNIYITGRSELSSGTNSSNSYSDFATVKINSSGIQQWVRRYDGTENRNDEAYAITIDNSGNIYVTGSATTTSQGKDYVTIKYNSSGTQQWLSTYNNPSANSDDIPKAILVTTNNDVVVTGSSKSSTAANSEDYLTIKYNASNGNEVFTARYNDSAANNSDRAYALAVPYSNNVIYITGSSRQSNASGSEDIVTIAYSSSGNFRQKQRIVNSGPDAGLSIVTDSNKDFLIGGYLSGSGSGYNMISAKYLDEVLSITNTGTGIPANFKLYQNYPNPFNPTTNIKFDVTNSGMVKIIVYNASGQEIYTAVNDYLPPGNYEVSFNLSKFSSGLYFYKMITENYSEIKKMIMIK